MGEMETSFGCLMRWNVLSWSVWNTEHLSSILEMTLTVFPLSRQCNRFPTQTHVHRPRTLEDIFIPRSMVLFQGTPVGEDIFVPIQGISQWFPWATSVPMAGSQVDMELSEPVSDRIIKWTLLPLKSLLCSSMLYSGRSPFQHPLSGCIE